MLPLLIVLSSVAIASAQQPYIGKVVTPLNVTGNLSRQSINPTPVPREIGEGRPEREPKLQTPAPPRIADPGAQLSGRPAVRGLTTQQLVGDLVVPGQNSNAFPPDTVGDVGPNHYVQMVNATTYQVFNKGGSPLTPPLNFGALWPGGPCQRNAGDPIVVYDHLADRWVLSQFAADSAGSYMCFAVSRTPNPVLNTWYLYEFQVPVFPDYPKVGVWPSGYFVSSYEGDTLGAYAFDRARMLVGAPANYIRFAIDSLRGSVRDTRILPSDLDGPAPSIGTPNYFVRTVDDAQDSSNPVDRIEIWAFQADFGQPFSTTFLPVQTITPAGGLLPFSTMRCNRNGGGFRDCIPQPGTANTLDALSNRPMMQLKFRDFGTHQAMVFNQTIEISGSIPNFVPSREVAGIRWYELRRANFSPWTIRQQSTYAAQDPGGPASEARILHRWMGSMAINKAGDIALGYSLVNGSSTPGTQVYPSIAYTGRLGTDPANLLWIPEVIAAPGTTSQTVTQRWGDYSAMSVDPVDDCTFWYTSHLAPVGAGPHPTRIASFRLSNCAVRPTADLNLRLSASPALAAGGTGAYTIMVENNSDSAAANVRVTFPIPGFTTFQSVSAPGWNCTTPPPGATVICTLPVLPALLPASFSVTVNVACPAPDGGRILASAGVTSDSTDPDTSNNTRTMESTVSNPAPVVSPVTPDASILLPADGRLVDVNLSYSVSDTCGLVNCSVSVSANEPVTGGVDYVVVNSRLVRLRALSTGTGRTYFITVTCIDESGNATQRSTFVYVPRG